MLQGSLAVSLTQRQALYSDESVWAVVKQSRDILSTRISYPIPVRHKIRILAVANFSYWSLVYSFLPP